MSRSRPRFARGLWRLGPVLGLVGLLAACDTEFSPYAEGPPYFALDARIDARQDTQFVRVQDLSIGPGAEPAPLPVTVTLETGGVAVATLRDSLVALDGGGTGHLFWTDAPLDLSLDYEIVAVRDADQSAESVGTFAFPDAVVLGDSQSPPSTLRTLQLNGESPRATPAFVSYVARRSDTGVTATVTVRHDFQVLAGVQTLPINLVNDAARIRDALDLPRTDMDLAELLDASVRYTAISTEPAEIDRGVGSVTWIVDLDADWVIPGPALDRVGLQNEQ
ncbi:MAG: hypothetical protein AAFQ43_14900, partial [Bacteroidota bacterium]